MLRRLIVWLAATAVLLPIVLLVLLALARLLAAMGDPACSIVLDRIALGLGIVWLADFVTLVLVLALERVTPPDGEA
jgi:hypothetical protein